MPAAKEATRMLARLPQVLGPAVLVELAVAAQADDPARVRLVAAPGGGRPIVAETGPQGEVHLVCDADDGPYYVKSVDNGETFTDPIKVVQGAPRIDGLEFQTWDMAIGKNGRVHVVLGTNAWKLKLPQDQWGLHYTSLDADAKAFTAVRNINGMPSEGYSIAADQSGSVAAFFLSNGLHCCSSRDDGKTFGPPREVNSKCDPCKCCTTSVAYGPEGKLACFYREESDNKRDMYALIIGKDGRHTRTRISSTPWEVNACPMTYFNVRATKDGWLAVWPTKGEIYFAKFDKAGKVVAPGEVRTPGKSGMRTGVLARALPSGETVVAWNSGGGLGWQVYDAKGKAVCKPGEARTTGTVLRAR